MKYNSGLLLQRLYVGDRLDHRPYNSYFHILEKNGQKPKMQNLSMNGLEFFYTSPCTRESCLKRV